MAQRLWIIGCSVLFVGGLWLVSRGLTPHRGVHRALEGLCAGIILCYCLGLLAAPFGIPVPRGPAAAAIAGALGLPGAALATVIGGP